MTTRATRLANTKLQRANETGDWSASFDQEGTITYEALCDYRGTVVALVVAQSPSLISHPNTDIVARRLAACWSACIGVETELLEAAGDEILSKALKKVEALSVAKAQQDHFEEQPDGTVIPVDPSEMTQQEQPASVDAYVGAREDTAIWKKRALEAEELNRKFIAELNGPTYLGEPAQQEQPAQEPVAIVECKVVHGHLCQFLNRTRHGMDTLKDGDKLYTHPTPTQPAQEPEAWLIPSLASFKDAKSVSFSRVEGCTLTDAQLIEKMSGEVLWRVEVFSDGDGVIDKHGAHHAPKPLYTRPALTQPALSDEQALLIAQATGAFDDLSLNYETEKVIATVKAVIEAHCRGGATS